MAHFAQLDENNVVINVVKVADYIIMNENGEESEELGISYLNSIVSENCRWVQTSYNDRIRIRYAPIGGFYRDELDAFFYKKPYPSWTINEEEYGWDPPVPKPQEQDGFRLEWNEDTLNWEYTELPSEPIPLPIEIVDSPNEEEPSTVETSSEGSTEEPIT
jgi:hypothetical protein